MNRPARIWGFAAAACFTLVLGAAPAFAKTHHHKHHVKHATTHHHSTKAKKGGAMSVRSAQEHLSHLGFYGGKVDGKMGPQTRRAIKEFQRGQGLKVDGILGRQTMRALEEADGHAIGSHSFPLPQTVFNSSDIVTVNPDYIQSINGSKLINSRYGNIEVTENGTGAGKTYSVNLNGQAILTADGQPSVIGISPTYDLGDEDAIVFTTYSPSDANCMYKSHVLALGNAGNQVIDIDNCTRAYQAHVDDGSLYLTFPEHDDNRVVGATWRVEGMKAERL